MARNDPQPTTPDSPTAAADALRADAARRWKLVAAFACVYVIWGSTYLAIRFAVETLPPFSMAGARFLLAGGALYCWTRFVRRAERPTRAQWRATAIVGLLLLLGGNGLLVWAEIAVPSGIAALLVATVPCWMVLIDWLRPNGVRPSVRVVAGLALGLCGVLLLVRPGSLVQGAAVDLVGAGAVVLGSFSWAVGSIYSRHGAMPRSPFLATAMEMLVGGAGLLAVGLVLGEPARFDTAALAARSVLGWMYLVVFGSIVAFTAYIWLLRESTPARVSTYAYVNPVVAVVLGWALADEALTPRMLAAAAVIVGGVALITLGAERRPAAK